MAGASRSVVHALMVMAVIEAPFATAGEPLFTDDDTLVDPGYCQVEAWAMPARDSHGLFAQPACNLAFDTELALGLSRSSSDGERSSAMAVQLKHIFFNAPGDAWAFGASAGAMRDTSIAHGRSAFDTWYAKGIVALAASDDLELDFNLGAASTYGVGGYALAGMAAQYKVSARTELLGEVYRDAPGHAKAQAGLRVSVVPDRFDVYASVGQPFGQHHERWAVIGIRVQSDRLLPQ